MFNKVQQCLTISTSQDEKEMDQQPLHAFLMCAEEVSDERRCH